MWQIWLIIIIILLITAHRYPGSIIFCFFITSIGTIILSLFINNLFIEIIIFFFCSLIIHAILLRFFPHSNYSSLASLITTDHLINQIGIVTKPISGSLLNSGLVYINNETWCAISNSPIKEGIHVQVVAVHGLRLTVIPIDSI